MLQDVFQQEPEIERVIIFGSRVLGNYRQGSDIDLALQGNISRKVLNNTSIQINQELPIPYKVDLLDYNLIEHLPLKEHIDRHGKIFYQKEPEGQL